MLPVWIRNFTAGGELLLLLSLLACGFRLVNGFREVCLWGLSGTMRDCVGGLGGAEGMALMWSLDFGMFACKAGVVWRAAVLSGGLMGGGLISLMVVFFR